MSATIENKIRTTISQRFASFITSQSILLASVEQLYDNSKTFVKVVEDEKQRLRNKKTVYFVANKSEFVNNVGSANSDHEVVTRLSLFIDLILNKDQLTEKVGEFKKFLLENQIDFEPIHFEVGYLFLVDETQLIDPMLVKLATNLYCKRIDVDLSSIIEEVLA